MVISGILYTIYTTDELEIDKHIDIWGGLPSGAGTDLIINNIPIRKVGDEPVL